MNVFATPTNRIIGELPVRPHLRPQHKTTAARSWVFTRDEKGRLVGWALSLTEARALRIEGEA